MNELTIILTIASIIVPVFATIYTAYIRVRNEKQEAHKPYLVIGEIEKLSNINRYGYFLAMGPKLNNISNSDIERLSKQESNVNVALIIKNIGYGVASNIKFYDLDDVHQIIGLQETSENINQKKFTTFDIPKDSEKRVQTCLITETENDIAIDDGYRILCIYQDLNNNIYDFIIGIRLKSSGAYDFFAYQRSSNSYKKMIKNRNKAYKHILKEYGK
jgi:hypothetical protein